MSLNQGLNCGRLKPNYNYPIIEFLFICGHLVSREESFTLRKIIASQRRWISHQLCPCCPQWETNWNRLRRVQCSAITFLALKDITAVSWLAAGLADSHGSLSARALRFRAGMEVAGALWRNRGAATRRWCVTLGQDWTHGTGGHVQSGTCHPGTSQLLWNTHIWTHVQIFHNIRNGSSTGGPQARSKVRQVVQTSIRTQTQGPNMGDGRTSNQARGILIYRIDFRPQIYA